MNSDKIVLAMDESQRRKDANGNLTVLSTVITKEGVNPYYGRDIPNSEALGLEPNQVYYLYRPLEEIEKGIDTFKRKPLLIKHIATSAKDPKKQETIGTIGSDLIIEDGKLFGDMEFWDDRAIELIETNKQDQLSAGYGYTLDLTSGEFNGVQYDGIMRNLQGNHVALVEQGRIGNDAIICDNKTVFFNEDKSMKLKNLGKLADSIKMAFDSGDEFTEEKAIELVKKADDELETEAKDNDHLRRDLLERGVPESVVDTVMESLGGIDGDKKLHEKAEDEDDKPKGLSEDEVNEKVDDAVKHAMDSYDKKHKMIELVKPLIGQVNSDKFKDAESVGRFALDSLNVEHKDIHASAIERLCQIEVERIGSKTKTTAFDSASRPNASALKQAFPHITVK